MFRTVSPSIIRSLRLYIQHQVYVKQVLWLLASWNEMGHFVPAIKQPQLYCAYGSSYCRNILLCTVIQMSEVTILSVCHVTLK
jgi:hypothetical protein